MVTKLALAAASAFLASITAMPAHAGQCPADQIRVDVPIEGPVESTGVEVIKGAAIELQASTGLDGVLQYLRVTIAPGGSLELHSHDKVPGFAYVLTGTAIEHRSDCAVAIVRMAGDIATEPSSVTHWWSNESETPVVLLVSHVVSSGAE